MIITGPSLWGLHECQMSWCVCASAYKNASAHRASEVMTMIPWNFQRELTEPTNHSYHWLCLVTLSTTLPSHGFGYETSKSITFLKKLCPVTFCWLENKVSWWGSQGPLHSDLSYALWFLGLHLTENNLDGQNNWGMCYLLYLRS